MSLPSQIQFPSPRSALSTAASSIPMLNTAAGQPSYNYPYGPPGTVNFAVPPPPMMGGPIAFPQHGFRDLFSGHPSTQNPGVVGFQGSQPYQFLQGNTITGALGNAGLNLAAGVMANKLPGGQALANGMIPLQQISGSRSGFYQARQRQRVADQFFKGEIDGVDADSLNPDLDLFGSRGAAQNNLFQTVASQVTGFRTQFNTAFGQLGSAFGGNLQDQGRGTLQFMAALNAGATREGGGVDFNLTQGLSRAGLLSSVTSAYRTGGLGVTSSDITKIADLTADGRQEEATSMARNLSGGVADALAAGRDVFGQGASDDEIMQNIGDIFGKEGLSDAGSAANRLREIEAAGQTLNMDGQSVARYMQVMKQMTKNVGMIGESGTDASLSMILRNEEAKQFGGRNDINVDMENQANSQADILSRNLNSQSAIEKTVISNVLNTTSKDALAATRFKVGGKTMTGAQMLKKMNEGYANPDMNVKDRAEFEQFLTDSVQAVNSSTSEVGKKMGNELRDRVANPDMVYENRVAEVQGRNSYGVFSAKSGIQENTLDVVSRGFAKYGESLQGDGGKDKRDLLNLITDGGTVEDFARKMGESGAFTALRDNDALGMKKRIRASIAEDLDKKLLEQGVTDRVARNHQVDKAVDMAAAMALDMSSDMDIYGTKNDDVAGMLAQWEQKVASGSGKTGTEKKFDATKAAVSAYGKIAGGAPTSGNITRRALEAIGREVNKGGDEPLVNRIANVLGEATSSDAVSRYTKLLGGDVNYTDDDGRLVDFDTLLKDVQSIEAGSGSQKDKDSKIKKITSKFWEKAQEQDPTLSSEDAAAKEGAADADSTRADGQDAVDKDKKPNGNGALGETAGMASAVIAAAVSDAVTRLEKVLEAIQRNTAKQIEP